MQEREDSYITLCLAPALAGRRCELFYRGAERHLVRSSPCARDALRFDFFRDFSPREPSQESPMPAFRPFRPSSHKMLPNNKLFIDPGSVVCYQAFAFEGR